MSLRRVLMMGMANGITLPSSIKIVGPVKTEQINNVLSLVFPYPYPKVGLFSVVADPVISIQDAVNANKQVAYGMTIYPSYSSLSPVSQGTSLANRTYNYTPSGTTDSWGNGSTFVFNENTVTITSQYLIENRDYYLVVVGALETL